MKKLFLFILTIIFLLQFDSLQAGLFGSDDDCKNEKIALEIKLKYCNRKKANLERKLAQLTSQYNNEKLNYEKTIRGKNTRIQSLLNRIASLKKQLALEKRLAAQRINALKKTISILRKKSSNRLKNLLAQNARMQKQYERTIANLKNVLAKEREKHRRAMDALRKKYEQQISSLKITIKNLNEELSNLKKLTQNQKKELDRMLSQQRELEKKLAHEIKVGQIRLKRFHNKLIINIDNKISFASGSATLKYNVKAALRKIGRILADYPENKIVIEGHTDSDKLFGGRFKDNWQLSAARALSVLRYILKNKKLDKSRFSLAGYGEFNPIVPNTSAKNKSLNRRVDIVVVPRLSNKK